MKISRNKKSKLPIIITLLVVAVAGAAYYFFVLKQQHTSVDKKGPTPAQLQEQKKQDDNRKKVFIENTKDKPNSGVSVPMPTNSDSITVSVSQESNDSVTIITKLSGYSSGDCVLRVTNGSREYNSSAAIIYQPEHSSCAGFSVPVTELGSGAWTISLDVTPTGGQAVHKQISAEVRQ